MTPFDLTRRHVTVAEGLARLPGQAGERFAAVFRHGSLDVELYAPHGHDPQTPHTRDEVYVVASGEGYFVNGPTRERFGPGDLLFVPAGVVHRFEEFSDDFAVWVLFYGPEGGEQPGASVEKTEIERKFLVDALPDGLNVAGGCEIMQGYLAFDGNEVRVRRKGDACTLGVKRGAGRVREETEVPITRSQFDALWPLTRGRRVGKTRYEMQLDGHRIEIDVYRGALEGMMTAEVEFDDHDACDTFTPPSWFGLEVTDDAQFKNRNLAAQGLPEAICVV